MKISLTYLYAIFRYGYPPKIVDDFKVFSEVQKLGFHFIEMEGLGRPKLHSLYKSRKRLLKALNDAGLHVHNFCVVDPDLVSLDAAKRNQAGDSFKLGAELGDFLGAETLHLASYAPPVRYLNAKPYQLRARGGYSFANHSPIIRIPKGFEWKRVWDTLVESCQKCADVAKQHRKTVIMEPRVGEVICSVDSLLRLIEQVGRSNFKANFDTAHFSAQRENVPLALTKLQGQFANIHIADNNPSNTEHLPLGDGTIDWKEFFRLLKAMKYKGYLGLDLGMSTPLVPGYHRSIKFIRSVASELKIHIEI
jgi:sugar phosphate isomerase/epimerase